MSDLIEEKLSVFDLFSNTARIFPNKIAISCDNHVLTYSELETQVNKLAHYLLLSNVNTDKPIIILLERSIYCYIAMLAIIKIGGTYVPIESEYPEERINLILEDVDYSLIITSNQQCERNSINIDNNKSFNISVEFASCNSIELPNNFHNNLSLQKFGHDSTASPMQDASSIEFAKRSNVSPDKTCYIIYTSGSTGVPKGVEVTYQNIFHYINAAQKLYKITYQDIIYQGFSLAFDASLEEIWMAFANGAQLVVATNKALRAGLDLHLFLNEHKVTVLSTVPSLLNNINEDIPSIRLLILGGEVCTSKIISKWHNENRQIFNTYGPTETTVVATALECIKDSEITLGKPLHGYETVIIDENNNIINNVGELCIGGPSVAKGYVNRPELTKQKFINDPRGSNKIFYKTGDKAEITENGEIKFYGRIDDQVKIRGFRVELNEIEAIINKHTSVKQSIAAYNIDGDEQLTIYIIPEKHQDIDLNSLRKYFKENLADYMVPNNIEIIKKLPLLSSGKVDKSKLPKPKASNEDKNYVAPTNTLETQVVEIWKKVFNKDKISITANFFYDLGGNSLLAAKAISEMRNIEAFKTISLIDIYNTANISEITKVFTQTKKPDTKSDSNPDDTAYIVPGWKHKLCGLGQFFGCVLQYSLYAWEFLIFYAIYLYVSKIIPNVTLSCLSTITLSILAYPFMQIFIVLASKWFLVGKIKEGKHKVWGFYYFRWWLYTRIIQNCNVNELLIGTPLIQIFYRLLGAKIGKNCYINTFQIYAPDLLTIGDNTSIGTKTSLNGYSIENGWLNIYPITIGKNCYLGSKCLLGKNTNMQDGSYLEHMSSVTDFSTLAKNEFYAGAPCRKITPPKEHFINQINNNTVNPAKNIKKFKYSILHIFSLMLLSLIHIGVYIPMGFGMYYIVTNKLYNWIPIFSILSPMICVPVYFLTTILIKNIIIRNIKPGTYSIYSMPYLRQWILTKMLNSPEILLLGDSAFFPMFLRKLNAKIGKNVEIGDSEELYPDFMHFSNNSFAASGAMFAEPSIYQGYIKYDIAKIGEHGFIGNNSLLPNGVVIGNKSLLGCESIAPYNNESATENTNWLGSPPIFLHKREQIDKFSDDLKFTPSKKLKYQRYGIEFLRIIFPSCLFLLSAFAFYIGFLWLENFSYMHLVIGLPLITIGCSLSMVLFFLGVKWILIGKYKPQIQPLWSTFIWKNDIILFWYDIIATPLYLNFTLGSPFANIYYRMAGTKVGKKTVIDSNKLDETDLISIGDYVYINSNCHLQTHLFEDRIYKISTINIESNCNLGTDSVVLYDTIMRSDSNLVAKSLLMKGETLPKNTYWEGIPAQYKS